jgi:hypothetical protein
MHTTREDGRAWFDDLFLIEAPPDISNMVLNGSFDGREIARGWPQWWSNNFGAFMPGRVGSDNPLWGTDDSTAFQGQKSLRVVCPQMTQPPPGYAWPQAFQQLPGGTRLQKGKSYALSAHMKANPPNLQVVMIPGEFGFGKSVRVGGDWQRYVVRATPEADQTGRFVQFELRQPGTLWIDAVQFEEGAEPTEFNEWRLDASSGSPQKAMRQGR